MKKQLMTFLLCGSLFAHSSTTGRLCMNPFIGTSNYGDESRRGLSAGYDERMVPFNVMGSGEEPF